VAKAWAHWLHDELGLSFGRCAKSLGRLGVGVTAGALSQAPQSTGWVVQPARSGLAAAVVWLV